MPHHGVVIDNRMLHQCRDVVPVLCIDSGADLVDALDMASESIRAARPPSDELVRGICRVHRRGQRGIDHDAIAREI